MSSSHPITPQTTERTLWIARHGNRQDFVDPDWRRTADRPGDPGLSEDGLLQAQELAQSLQHEPIDHIFASPFLRAVQTAAPTAAALSLPLHLEPGLGEYLNPKFFEADPRRLSMSELQALFPEVTDQHQALVQPSYPESWEQLLQRTGQTIQLLTQAYTGNLLLVGHAASVVGLANGLVPQMGDFQVPLCCVTKLVECDRNWIVATKGNTRHLTTRSNRFLDLLRFWGRKLWSS